uniref:Uncharacterized protein n=1 Tax=Vicia faba TaxID=3906 RepID=R4IUS0_VICFA|nr:hypothetical protein [Vicia faba]AGC78854.1 hypothetical protein [Vicia faba]
MHAFMEGLFPSSLTRIYLGIPTSVPPNSVKSLEHVLFFQDPCQERSQSLLISFMLNYSKRESIHVLHHFLGRYRPGSVLSLLIKSRCVIGLSFVVGLSNLNSQVKGARIHVKKSKRERALVSFLSLFSVSSGRFLLSKCGFVKGKLSELLIFDFLPSTTILIIDLDY